MRNIQDFQPGGNEQISKMLRELPKQQMPELLKTNLRVLASKERSRAITHKSFSSTLETWGNAMSLWYGNLMRPLVIPFTGGISAAALMFGLLYPTLVSSYRPIYDQPTTFYEEAQVSELWPLGVAGASKLDAVLVVDVAIDEQGRMISYSVPTEDEVFLRDQVLRRSIETNLLVTKFKPANFFGSPTQGKVRLTIPNKSMEVKG